MEEAAAVEDETVEEEGETIGQGGETMGAEERGVDAAMADAETDEQREEEEEEEAAEAEAEAEALRHGALPGSYDRGRCLVPETQPERCGPAA